ncbi:2-oxoacid:ferredoxin oxidoreductase subunit beta [Pseudothermotoga thermarum]|uniref:2-oxoglutarate ferredoxin oxidoreductase, beta subunit n=1 Tax=Pseudothermotoga thermarum DSM 5069 TaxID=688269 RepID=F7YYI1_9THEM|nr:2-oxoacid:ferredoxin oxidoreductase subunit beta [Pseudothermotoga thermarum]AEH51009.1 2-oxoglutarate ferredoxin oxidoreductase, beta subunit [Pseudothermotoga thermarum DSM 5069]
MKVEKLITYLREERWPSIWCAGCGNGIVLKAFLQAIDDLKLNRERIAVVSGIGCSSRATGYIDFNTLHTLHGRAIAFATGVKLARPDFHVAVLGGDGDILAIGGNHFIHACRRNIDITIIIFNNMIYGMTGGQNSPTTPLEKRASTTPYGNIEKPFDTVKLAIAAGATYVARATVYHYPLLVKYITKALQHKGTAVVEAVTNCHTYYGRYNNIANPADMLEYFKKNSIMLEKAKTMSEEELKDKIIIGEFHQEIRPDYLELYREVVAKALEEE